MNGPQASILIPTHDHYLTLPLAVELALNHSLIEIEVIIIGDGVTDLTRRVIRDLVASDTRVRFLDYPKGENHGEKYRDLAIKFSRSEFIFYLCDDDLFMPSHVENLLTLLKQNGLAQSKNGYFNQNGELHLYPGHLSLKGAIEWHLKEPRRNLVSLTGTAHKKQTYLSLSSSWNTTPVGEWPDHFMWKKFFKIKGFRASTHPEMTALQFPTSDGREQMNQIQRQEELEKWFQILNNHDTPSIIRYLVYRSTLKQLAEIKFQKFNLKWNRESPKIRYGISKISFRNLISLIAFRILARTIIKTL
jgi:glycosyltransferase involved in cell wall biosynthesis